MKKNETNKTFEVDYLALFIEKIKYNGIDKFLIKKYDIPRDIADIDQWKENASRYLEFKHSISRISKLIHLPDFYYDWLEDFILIGISMTSKNKIKAKLEFNEVTKQNELWVRVYSNTRRDDIAKEWESTIKPLQKKLPNFLKKINKNGDFAMFKYVYDSKIHKLPNSEIKWKGILLNSTEIAKAVYEYKRLVEVKNIDLSIL